MVRARDGVEIRVKIRVAVRVRVRTRCRVTPPCSRVQGDHQCAVSLAYVRQSALETGQGLLSPSLGLHRHKVVTEHTFEVAPATHAWCLHFWQLVQAVDRQHVAPLIDS